MLRTMLLCGFISGRVIWFLGLRKQSEGGVEECDGD